MRRHQAELSGGLPAVGSGLVPFGRPGPVVAQVRGSRSLEATRTVVRKAQLRRSKARLHRAP